MGHHGVIPIHRLQQTEIPHQFYGLTTHRDKLPFLQNMDWIGTIIRYRRWILGGDFKMICNIIEKIGGIQRLDGESDHLQSLIDKLSLIDLETHNGLFTWLNQISCSQQVTCLLDHFLI
jgi:hypothetical protein